MRLPPSRKFNATTRSTARLHARLLSDCSIPTSCCGNFSTTLERPRTFADRHVRRLKLLARGHYDDDDDDELSREMDCRAASSVHRRCAHCLEPHPGLEPRQ